MKFKILNLEFVCFQFISIILDNHFDPVEKNPNVVNLLNFYEGHPENNLRFAFARREMTLVSLTWCRSIHWINSRRLLTCCVALRVASALFTVNLKKCVLQWKIPRVVRCDQCIGFCSQKIGTLNFVQCMETT